MIGRALVTVVATASFLASWSVGTDARQATSALDYRVLATNRTGTMENEMNQAAEAGFRFKLVMGGETVAGNEVVAIMERTGVPDVRYQYRLLATNRTSTMQREMQQASEDGYDYVGQTIFKSTFGGDEVTCILERVASARPNPRFTYRLLATNRTGTMQKEIQAAAAEGFEVIGLTLGKTSLGGNELVTIVRRPNR